VPRTLTSALLGGRTLSSNGLIQWLGLYPAFYPGPTAFPGRGNLPLTSAIVARAALYPPFYPGATAFPGRGSNLTTEAA
jgi:hypothetical protein